MKTEKLYHNTSTINPNKMENKKIKKITEISFSDNKIGMYFGENSEYIITQEVIKTGKKQEIILTELEMASVLRSLKNTN